MTDDTYTVERSATIHAPAERIFPEIADFHRWTAWSPWEDLDPALERTYSGPDAGVGAAYAWSGNRRAGRGRMAIVEVAEPRSVRIDLVFEKPFRSRSDSTFTIRPEGEASVVTWTMTGSRTLATKLMGIVISMDKLVGKDFEKGLARLKAVAEVSGG